MLQWCVTRHRRGPDAAPTRHLVAVLVDVEQPRVRVVRLLLLARPPAAARLWHLPPAFVLHLAERPVRLRRIPTYAERRRYPT